MLCAPPGSDSMASCTSRIGARLARGIHTGAANCVWPPGRRRYITSQRATVCATSVPWSSSTSDRARSMPAVTPAAVQTLSELLTKIGSGSTVTEGNSRPICSANAQCVVAVQPSINPAWAARNAPVHTLTTRRVCSAAIFIQPSDVRIAPGVVHAPAAGQHQRVDGVSRIGQRLRDEREAGARGGRLAVAGDDLDGVTLVAAIEAGQADRRAGEHLERADQVEGLDARIAEDHHGAHVFSVGDPDRGV